MKRFVLAMTAMVLTFMFNAVRADAAVTEISCWNMYAKTGSKPILKADILNRTTLTDVAFNLKDEKFESYFEDKVEDSGERWGHKPAYTKSTIASPTGNLEAKEITTKRSSYIGNNEYVFEFGRWSFVAPYITQSGSYDARIILPKDLSPAALKAFRIRTKTERSNAVMVYTPSHAQHQGGDNYLRMFCVSR